MKRHSRVDRIQLEIECCRLSDFLLVARQLCETIGKCVGDEEIHMASQRSQRPPKYSRSSISSLGRTALSRSQVANVPIFKAWAPAKPATTAISFSTCLPSQNFQSSASSRLRA